jgi:hypothetical protein
MISMAVMGENWCAPVCSPFVCHILLQSMTYEKSVVFHGSRKLFCLLTFSECPNGLLWCRCKVQKHTSGPEGPILSAEFIAGDKSPAYLLHIGLLLSNSDGYASAGTAKARIRGGFGPRFSAHYEHGTKGGNSMHEISTDLKNIFGEPRTRLSGLHWAARACAGQESGRRAGA